MSLRSLLHATRSGGAAAALLALSGALGACFAPERASDGSEADTPEFTAAREAEVGEAETAAGESDRSTANVTRPGRVKLQVPNGTIEVPYELIDGIPIAEGDIVVPVETQAATRVGRRWDDAVVPYAVDPNLPDASRIDAAIAHWEEQTNVRFVPRTTEGDYLWFRPGTGCSSFIGRSGGKQLTDCLPPERPMNDEQPVPGRNQR